MDATHVDVPTLISINLTALMVGGGFLVVFLVLLFVVTRFNLDR
jgi:hypothetical protein